MDTASLWIAVAGLSATTIASVLGLYFTHKAQRSPLREQLFSKQIEVLSDFSVHSCRLQKVAAALQETTGKNPDETQGLDELWDSINYEILDIVQRGAVVLPSELYSAMTAFRVCAEDFEIAIVKSTNIGKAYYDLMGAGMHVAMLSRDLLGADRLSKESLKLHGLASFQQMQEIGRVSLARVGRALWTQSRRMDNKDPG